MWRSGKLYPLSWEELKLHPSPIERDPAVQDKYEEQKKLLRKDGESVENKLLKDYPQLKSEILVLPNKFPYYVAEGIQHLVAWIPPSMLSMNLEGLDVYIARRISNHLRAEGVIVFENPPEARSVKNLRHFHVFIK